MNVTDDDTKIGLYNKFGVFRRDGRSEPGEKHFGCEYFVLDLNHDPHAKAALGAYARSCIRECPALGNDLVEKVLELQKRFPDV